MRRLIGSTLARFFHRVSPRFGVGIVLAGAVLVGLSLVFVTSTRHANQGKAAPSKPAPPRVVLQRDAPVQPAAVTLLGAWRIATQAAHTWEPGAALLQLQSVDGTGDAAPGATPGADGRRTTWLGLAAAPGRQDRELRIKLVNGVVVSAVDEPRASSLAAPPGEPTVDSPRALAEAQAARLSFGPGTVKLRGYGFFAEMEQPGLVVGVVGEYRCFPARVTFDGLTGRLLAAQVAAPESHLFVSGDLGEHWSSASIGPGFVTGIATDGTSGTAFVVVNTVTSIELWSTTDGGRSWTKAGLLPEAAATWAYGLALAPDKRLALGAATGLWLSSDEGRSWRKASGLPAGPPQWIVAVETAVARGLAVSISSGPDAGVYFSANLQSWSRLAQGVYRLSPTGDGRVVALADGPQGAGFVIVGPQARPVTVPAGSLRAAGSFSPGGWSLAESPSAIEVSPDGGASWSEALRGHATSLAVAHGASQDVVVVGMAAGAVARSVDGGRTWIQASPPAMRGAGTVSILAFLSRSVLLAAAEGEATSWQGF